MKQTVVIASSAVAGLLAGSLSPLLFSPGAPRGTATTRVAPSLAPGVAPGVDRGLDPGQAAEQELAELRTRLDELSMRIAWLEDAAADPRVPARPAEVPLAGAATESLSELAGALHDPSRPLPENLKLGVEQVIQDVREAERRERDERRSEVLQERTEERLAELVTELGLTPVQTNLMRDHLAVYAEKRTQLFDTARENDDFFNVRDTMRALRKESNDALATILDPTQLERYQEFDDGWGRGRDDGRDDGRRERGDQSGRR